MEPTKRAATCTSGKRISIHGRIRVMKGLILLLCVFLLPVSAVKAAGTESSQSKTAAASEGETEVSAAETDSTGENAGSTENGTGTGGEGETENGAETEGEGKTEDSTETGTETDGESETETGTENESGNSGEGETESGDGTETDEGGEIETETETETEFEEETQELPLEEEVVLLDAPMNATDEVTSAADLYKWGIDITTGNNGYKIASVFDKTLLPTVLKIPDDVDDIAEDVFRGCDKIEEVIFPDNFVSIRSGVFADCMNLKKVTLGSRIYSSEGGAFTGCSSLQEIDLSRMERQAYLLPGTFDLGISDGTQCLEVLRVNHMLLNGYYSNLFFNMPVKHLYVYDNNLSTSSNVPTIYESCKDVFAVLDNMGIKIDKLESIDAVIITAGTESYRDMTESFLWEMMAKEYITTYFSTMSEKELWEMCFGEDTEISADFTGALSAASTGKGLISYDNFIEYYKDAHNGLWDAATQYQMDIIYNTVLMYIGVKADELKAKSDAMVIVEQEAAQKSINEAATLPFAEAFVLSGENPVLEEQSTNGVPVQVEAIPDSSETPEPESEIEEQETEEINSEVEPETEGSNTNTKPETEESNTEQETEEPDINSEPETGETDQKPETEETNTETDVPQKETNVLPEGELLEKEELNLELINEEPVTEVMATSTDVTSPADLGNWGINYRQDADGYHILSVLNKDLLPKGMMHLPEGVVSIEAYAFENCDQFRQFGMPISLEFIGEGAFKGCSNLTDVFSESGLKEIGKYAFQDCTALKSISLYKSENLRLIGEKCFSSTGEQIVLEKIDLNEKIAGKSINGSFHNVAMKQLWVYETETVYANGAPNEDLFNIWMRVFRESDKFGWNLSIISDDTLGALTWVIRDNTGLPNGYPVGDMVLNELVAEYYANNMKLQEMNNDELWDTCFGEKSSVSVNFSGILPEGESGIISYTSFCDFYQKTRQIVKYFSRWPVDIRNSLDNVLFKMIDDLSARADVLAGKDPVIITDDIVENQTVVPVEPVVEETQTLASIESVAEELQTLPPTEPETVTPSAAADSQPMETVDSNAEKGQNIAPAEPVVEEPQNIPPAEPVIEEPQNVPPTEPVVEEVQNVPPAEPVAEETQNIPPAEPIVEKTQNIPPAEPVVEEPQNVPPAEPAVEEAQSIPPVEPVAEEPQIPAPIETAVPEPPIYVPAGAADPVTETNEAVEPIPADMILEEVPLHVHIPQGSPDVLTEAETAFRQMAEWGITTSWNEAGDLVVVGVADASSMPSPEVLAEYGINVSGTGLNPGQIICAAN